MANSLVESFEQYLTFALKGIASIDLELKQGELSDSLSQCLLLRHRYISLALELRRGLEELKNAELCNLAVLRDNEHQLLMVYLCAEAETGNWSAGSFTARLERADRAKQRWGAALATVWEHQSGCRVCVSKRSGR